MEGEVCVQDHKLADTYVDSSPGSLLEERGLSPPPGFRGESLGNNTCSSEHGSTDGEPSECRLCKHCGCMLTTDYVWLRNFGNSDLHVSQNRKLSLYDLNSIQITAKHNLSTKWHCVQSQCLQKWSACKSVSSLVRASTPSYQFWRCSLQCVMSMTAYDSEISFVIQRETSKAQCFSEACPGMRLRLQARAH